MTLPDPEVLRARQAALQEQLARRRAKLRAGLPPRSRRRLDWRDGVIVVLVGLLIVCAVGRCEPEAVVAPDCVVPVVAPDSQAGGASSADVKGRVQPLRRPEVAVENPEPLSWLEAYRMQVAARGMRLSACFVGTDHPGALKWTALVEPVEGRVSAHELSPMLQTAPLTRTQQACVLEVLSSPPYQLKPGKERATPSRVGVVIEF